MHRARRPSEIRRRVQRIDGLLRKEYGVPRRTQSRDLVATLIGTILSQNTTDVNSGRAFAKLREKYADWGDVARADARSIAAAIRVGGLSKIKAARIKSILREVKDDTGAYELRLLRTMSTDDVIDYLRGFDGVGLKTAACVALFGMGRDVMPVDTHVHRVIGRLGIVGRPSSREETFKLMKDVTAPGLTHSLHVNLINLGREYCRPSRPDCGGCPLRPVCAHAREGQ